jgi:hypothetical protein
MPELSSKPEPAESISEKRHWFIALLDFIKQHPMAIVGAALLDLAKEIANQKWGANLPTWAVWVLFAVGVALVLAALFKEPIVKSWKAMGLSIKERPVPTIASAGLISLVIYSVISIGASFATRAPITSTPPTTPISPPSRMPVEEVNGTGKPASAERPRRSFTPMTEVEVRARMEAILNKYVASYPNASDEEVVTAVNQSIRDQGLSGKLSSYHRKGTTANRCSDNPKVGISIDTTNSEISDVHSYGCFETGVVLGGDMNVIHNVTAQDTPPLPIPAAQQPSYGPYEELAQALERAKSLNRDCAQKAMSRSQQFYAPYKADMQHTQQMPTQLDDDQIELLQEDEREIIRQYESARPLIEKARNEAIAKLKPTKNAELRDAGDFREAASDASRFTPIRDLKNNNSPTCTRFLRMEIYLTALLNKLGDYQ